MGLRVLQPDVTLSPAFFSVVTGDSRFGLAAIKNVGLGPVSHIIEEREQGGPFTNFFNFCERVDGSKAGSRAIECLILAGAMDSFEGNRPQLLHVMKQAPNGRRHAPPARVGTDVPFRHDGGGSRVQQRQRDPPASARRLDRPRKIQQGKRTGGHLPLGPPARPFPSRHGIFHQHLLGGAGRTEPQHSRLHGRHDRVGQGHHDQKG